MECKKCDSEQGAKANIYKGWNKISGSKIGEKFIDQLQECYNVCEFS